MKGLPKKLLQLTLIGILATALLASSQPSDFNLTTAARSGPQTVFVALLDFPDEPSGFTVQQYADAINGMCSYIASSSYGAASMVPTITPIFYTLPQPSTYYGLHKSRSLIATDALAVLAPDYGDVLNDYNLVIYCFPQVADWGLSGFYQAQQIWMNGRCNTWLFTHEAGHFYGLGHAGKWVPCDLTNPVDLCGQRQDHGDCYDMMGEQGADHDFNPFEKQAMGWIGTAQLHYVTATGIYRVHRFDSPSAGGFTRLALVFPQPGGTNRTYYVAYRYDFLPAGAYVMWIEFSGVSTLIDYVSTTPKCEDAYVPVGGSILDQGLIISTVDLGGTDPDRWIDVQVTLPSDSPSPSP
jgi:hypothetical protein